MVIIPTAGRPILRMEIRTAGALIGGDATSKLDGGYDWVYLVSLGGIHCEIDI